MFEKMKNNIEQNLDVKFEELNPSNDIEAGIFQTE